MANRRSMCGGSTFAAVGKKPSMAKPSPPRMTTSSVTITPTANFPMSPSGRFIVADGWGRTLAYGGRRDGESGLPCQMCKSGLARPDNRWRVSPHEPGRGRMRPPLRESIRLQAARFADHVFHLGQVVMLLRWRERDRGV